MTYQLAIHPDALADIETAGKWYEEGQPGLGADFSRTIRQAINTLPANSWIYCLRERRRQVRWFFSPRFPYRIVYQVKRDLITIVAVLHTARHDRGWRERLGSQASQSIGKTIFPLRQAGSAHSTASLCDGSPKVFA